MTSDPVSRLQLPEFRFVDVTPPRFGPRAACIEAAPRGRVSGRWDVAFEEDFWETISFGDAGSPEVGVITPSMSEAEDGDDAPGLILPPPSKVRFTVPEGEGVLVLRGRTGVDAYSRDALLRLPLLANSDNFLFDNQILAQARAFGLRIGEISCPARYFPEASSIRFQQSVRYGLGVMATSLSYRLWKWGLARPRIFRDLPEFHLEKAR